LSTRPGTPELRPTRADDLPRLRDVFLAATGELFGRLGLQAPAPSEEAFAAVQGHIAETGISTVAERDGRIEGFASALVRGEDWFLSSLYVLPGAQGAGLGSRAARALAAELARAEGTVRVRVLGSARQLVRVALGAGLRLSPVTGFLLCSDGVEPPTALAPSGYALF
jgi:GNAT superfamily N-acetyltransferase